MGWEYPMPSEKLLLPKLEQFSRFILQREGSDMVDGSAGKTLIEWERPARAGKAAYAGTGRTSESRDGAR